MIAYLYDLSETVVSFCLEDVADIQNKLLQQINTWWINKNLQTWAVTYLSFKKQYLFTSVLLFCSFLLTRTSRTPTIEFQAFIPRCLKTSDVGLNFNTCLNKCSVLERVVAANWDCSAPSSGCSTLVSLIQEWNISSKPEWIYSPQTKPDLTVEKTDHKALNWVIVWAQMQDRRTFPVSVLAPNVVTLVQTSTL